MISINGHIIGDRCFPNNERILEIPNWGHDIFKFEIELKYTTDIDLSLLVFCKKYLDDRFHNPKVTLLMKYVPYSRMDRNIDGFMFSLKYFCDLVNSLNFDVVKVLDVHSNVTTALLNRCEELSIENYIDIVFEEARNIDFIFYPDGGSVKRYGETLKTRRPYFHGDKKRNLQTGKIISYELADCPDIKGKDILIIDDLCATGYTFYMASQKLKEQGAGNIYLYVSHCEDSIYNGLLLKSGLITRVFTTNSILSNWASSLICNVDKK